MIHSDHALARRYEQMVARILANHVEALAKLKPELGACTFSVADGTALYVGKGTPPGPNRVTGLGMAGPVTADDLVAAESFYGERGLPTVVAANPMADPSLLLQAAARGYYAFTNRNVLVQRVDGSFVRGVPSRITATLGGSPKVEVSLAGPEDADIWSQTVGSGFAERELDGPEISHLATFHCPSTACYLARIEGEPAGGGAITFADGLAYVWDVSTRPSFRRRGVQRVIYEELVRVAAAADCELVGLTTEVAHASQRNAERVGFQVAYTATALVKPLPSASSS